MLVPAIATSIFSMCSEDEGSQHPEPSLRYWLTSDSLLNALSARYDIDLTNKNEMWLNDLWITLNVATQSYSSGPSLGSIDRTMSHQQCRSRNSDVIQYFDDYVSSKGTIAKQLLDMGLFDYRKAKKPMDLA